MSHAQAATYITATPSVAPTTWAEHGVRWLLYLLVIITPFAFTWVNEELFEFPKMLVVYAIVGVAVGLALIDHALIGSWRRIKTSFDWPIVAFVLSQTLSTVLSIHPYTSWWGYYTRFNGGLLSTLAYVSVYYLLVRYFSVARLKNLSWLLILVGIVAALYAWPEHFGHSPSCLLLTHEFNASCWVQDVKTRVFGTFGQPNWLAAYVITLLPLSLSWLSIVKIGWKKYLLIGAWILFFSVLLFTKSRSGLLGWGVSLGVWSSLLLWQWWQVRSTQSVKNYLPWRWLLGLLIGTGLFIAWMGTAYTPAINSLIKPKAEVTVTLPKPTPAPAGTALDRGGTESGEIRKIVWAGAIKIWQRYPIFGSGVETFAYSYYQDRPEAHNHISEWDFLYNKAHNELLNYLSTTGLVGLLTYLLLWAALGWHLLRWLWQPSSSLQITERKLLAIGWAAGLTAQFVSNFFGFSTVMINVLWWVGLASIAGWIAAEKPEPTTSSPQILFFPQWAKYVLLAIGCLLSWTALNTATRLWLADRDYALSKAYFGTGNYEVSWKTLQTAIAESPREALFWDELSSQYSRVAAGLQASPRASVSGETIKELTNAAILASDQTLALNNRHLDFYKTRARVMISLSPIDSKYLAEAEKTLLAAEKLSPTDPKLTYHLGLVRFAAGKTEQGLTDLNTAVTMKPDYLAAWFDLGKSYEQASQSAKAKQVYEHILHDLTPDNPEVMARLKALEATPQR
jgi:putative inorganic carbon (HCO3(-)) transporter